MHRIVLSLLTLLALALGGCVTSAPPMEAGAVGYQGQVLHQGDRRWVAEFVLKKTSPLDVELVLSKAGGPPLLSIRRRDNFGWATGPLAGPGWRGKLETAPPVLRPWLEALDRLCAPPEPSSLVHESRGTRLDFRIQ